jgi:hypothetical protein
VTNCAYKLASMTPKRRRAGESPARRSALTVNGTPLHPAKASDSSPKRTGVYG